MNATCQRAVNCVSGCADATGLKESAWALPAKLWQWMEDKYGKKDANTGEIRRWVRETHSGNAICFLKPAWRKTRVVVKWLS